MFPSTKQWRRWTLPSKLTAIGTYVSILTAVVSAAFYIPSALDFDLVGPLFDDGVERAEESQRTKVSEPEHKISRTRGTLFVKTSVSLADGPNGPYDDKKVMPGAKFTLLKYASTDGGSSVDWYIVSDGTNGEKWIRARSITTRDPRFFFKAIESGLVGYLIGSVYSDGSGATCEFVLLDIDKLGTIRLKIAEIQRITIFDQNTDSVVELLDGRRYIGNLVSVSTSRYVSFRKHSYIVSQDTRIDLGNVKNVSLEKAKKPPGFSNDIFWWQ